MALSEKERLQLRDALASAFGMDELDQLLFFRLGKTLEDYSVGNRKQTILNLIRASEREGWTDGLVVGAREENDGNVDLKAFADQFLRYRGTSQQLEKIINDTNSFLDVAEWRTKLGEIEQLVCSVEIGGIHYGTGFLIGEDQVITNYHVIEDLLAEPPQKSPNHVRLRFDYKVAANGEEVNDGVRYKLDVDNWLLDHSKYSEADLDDSLAGPGLDELDYAVLKVAPKDSVLPGNEIVMGENIPRGWLDLPSTQVNIEPHHPLFIIQHPDGKPLKLALDMDGITSINGNGTRVKYTTNTEPGSSGSPCFNGNWDLIALHHAGDPAWKAKWNLGVPIDKIAVRYGASPGALADSESESGDGGVF